MSYQSIQDIEIICPDHQQKVIFFSQNSEPKCHMCLAKTDIPLDQFVKNVENYRKDKISTLKQSQSTYKQKLSQLKKHLITNKEQFAQSMDSLIKALEEKTDKLISGIDSEINQLGKAISSLQINELKQCSIEMNSKVFDCKEQQKDQILLFVIKEYENLQSQTNIIKQLQGLQQQKEQIIDQSKPIDPQFCVPGITENLNIKSIFYLTPNQGKLLPLMICCPPQCNCKSYKSITWSHQICKSPLFIDEFGEVFCTNYKSSKECQSYFIKNAKFKCTTESQTQKFQTAAQFLMAFTRTAQKVCNDQRLSNYFTVDFFTTLNQSILKQWKQ